MTLNCTLRSQKWMCMYQSYKFLLSSVIFLTLSGGYASASAHNELPPWVSWSEDPLPFTTVAVTFTELSKVTKPVLGRDKTFVTISNWNGELPGLWRFSGGSVEIKPTRYWRYIIAPGNDWHITVSWACDESELSCEQFRNKIAGQLPPPPPPQPSS